MNGNNEEIIIRFLNGELGNKELQEFEKWLDNSEENTRQFNAMRDIWLASALYMNHENFDVQKGLKKAGWLMKWRRMQEQSTRRKRKINVFLRYAAMVLLLLSMGTFFGWYTTIHRENASKPEICEIFSPLGSKSQVTLPDGSRVWINAKSKITYRTDFNTHDRIVDLTGEAYFNVTTNKDKPFIVRTPHLTVKAYGTEFNVAAYPEEKTVSATLVKGNIVVRTIDNADSQLEYHLKQKENITYYIEDRSVHSAASQEKKAEKKEKPVSTKIPDDNIRLEKNVKTILYTSWKDDTWLIEGITLDDLAKQLERRYNTKIIINSEDLKNYKFTGTLRNETLEQVLRILVLTTPLKYTVDVGEVKWDLDSALQKKYSKLLQR